MSRRVLCGSALCVCVIASDPLGGWQRPSGWEPSPTDGKFPGQSQACTTMYREWISSFVRSYRTACTARPLPSDTSINAIPYSPPGVAGGKVNLTTATEGGCAAACLDTWSSALPSDSTDQPSPPEDDTGSQGAGRGLAGSAGVPDLPNSSALPYSRLSAVWQQSSETCWCALGGPLSSTSSSDLVLAKQREAERCDCTAPSCGMVELAVPLGCLWTGREGCIGAPADSCVWTLDGCCADSKGYNWPNNGSFHNPPWWAWVAGAVLTFSTCVLLVLLRRLQVPALPEPDDPGLSQELMQQHMEDYEALLRSYVTELPASGTMSECSVCLEPLASSECVQLKGCGHFFHHECMRDYVQHQVQSGKRFPKCPNCRCRLCPDDETLKHGGGEHSPPYDAPVLSPPGRGREEARASDEDTESGSGGGSVAERVELAGVSRVDSITTPPAAAR